MKYPALALASWLSVATPLSAHEPTLLLMGGSYRTCSSLDTDDCLPGRQDFAHFRQASQYRLDRAAFAAILDPAYWTTRDRPPPISSIKRMLESAHARAMDRSFHSADLIKLFESVDSVTWTSLVVPEQDMILSAFEMPQFVNGTRLKEGVAIDGSSKPFDAQLFRRFVQEAAKRSPGKKPRIAFVTSAAANNFDAVDFYTALLEQAGADAIWWPIDASMNAAINGKQGCDALPRLRQNIFSQIGRERVFPDLNEQQRKACLNAKQLTEVPLDVQAVFLDGGDQWLHWNTFFSPDGKENLWLQNLRTAYKTGDLVVAGTSAGTAVQSGPAMITNGRSSHALARGAKIYAGMAEGCEQAKRCPDGFNEEDFTYWPSGGLSLAGPLLMDTHVSERKREMRLLTLLNSVDAEAGIGVDETSAVLLSFGESTVAVEALGMSGAWWMMKPTPGTETGSYSLTAHYLAPGRILHWRGSKLLDVDAATFNANAPGKSALTDAITGQGMRAAVWKMTINRQTSTELTAGNYRIVIGSSPESHTWQGPEGQQGITDLHLEIKQIK